MQQLVARLEVIGERNVVLDEALQRAMAQSKQDQTDMVALRARLKSSKHKVDKFDAMQSALTAAEDKVRDAVTMKHMYKQQVDALKRRIGELEEAAAGHAAAAKQWTRTHDHMQSIVETHTKDLVGEIETLQRQVAKVTKKYEAAVEARRALELKVHERNATIAKLHQANQAASSPTHRSSQSQARRQPSAAASTPRTSDAAPSLPTDKAQTLRLTPNPAEEMESLLKKLERISHQYK
ncbi:Aste57867_14879 [Aphanomyces stellatus]|uniref:Aste57867_14879 protein n=1 Tax=Aphanomyces stellatus TaxID=120398 RepID=A0A485L1U3_9STRA|nr:hypothetical protein As57867_014823 [Aphanomyces stellatus]VFT91696.1 Aste57867_14879 [Aphanomyces stellatus]